MLQLGLGLVIVVLWECSSAFNVVDPFFFSRPSEIFARIVRWTVTGAVWQHLLATLTETILSFAIGGCLGIVLGFALATLPFLAALLDPYVRIANALPRVVLAPIFLL